MLFGSFTVCLWNSKVFDFIEENDVFGKVKHKFQKMQQGKHPWSICQTSRPDNASGFSTRPHYVSGNFDVNFV